MGSTPPDGANWEEHPTAGESLPEFVDWLLGAIIALGGMVALVGGSAIVFLVDREGLAREVEEGTVSVTLGTTELSEAETLDVADAVVSWTGTGLLVTGLGMIAVAIGFVALRHRAHSRAGTDGSVRSFGTYAVIGAIATAFLSFLPFSPALGGALAGYLERGESERTVGVGTLAGLLPVLPALVLLLFVFIGLVRGLLAVGQAGGAIVVGAAMIFAMLFVATVGAALGALGGYVGGRIAESRAASR